MKKVTVIAIICFVVFSVLITGGIIICGNISKNFKILENENFDNYNLSDVEDGEYLGSFHVFPLSAEVKVTIKNQEITKIDILKHENGKGEAAEAITENVITEQTLDVDAVTGATYSCKVILLAIQDALENAKRQSNGD